MATTLGQADITLTRGAGVTDYLDFEDELEEAVDLTGYDARMQVREGDPSAGGGTLKLDLGIGTGLALGTPTGGLYPSRIVMTITAAQTLGLTATDDDTGAGNYWWDMAVTPPGGAPSYVPDDGPAKVVVFERITQL